MPARNVLDWISGGAPKDSGESRVGWPVFEGGLCFTGSLLAWAVGWVAGVFWLTGHVLGFCITPIPYCVQQFLWVVKAGKMP